jgi:hypothetical protein
MAGAVRDYQFIVGPETSTLPTPGTPVDPGDVVTLAYADATYAKLSEWAHPVQTVAAVKAIAAVDRSDKQLIFVEDLGSVFQFDSGSSATGDDVTVITPTAGTGRWLRVADDSFTASNALVANATGHIAAVTYAAAFNLFSPMTTDYDLITRIAGVAARLAKGAANQVLIMDGSGSTFGWGNAPAVATNANDSAGDVTVNAGTSYSVPFLHIVAADTFDVSGQLVVADSIDIEGELVVQSGGILVVL